MPKHITRRNVLAGLAGSVLSHSLPSRFASTLLKRQSNLDPSELARFRERLKGRLILPGDRDYDSVRRVASFNPTSDKHPQMIVRCTGEEDVVRAIAFARDKSLEAAIRSGGHDLLGASASDGLVIDVSPMRAVRIDQQQQTARVEPGIRAGELNAATQKTGLAAALGCHPGVGVAGLTLGGGLGWFLGTHGAACDNLTGADVVSADGRSLRASAAENADLFWALRGGGGNFGVVTALEYKLHKVGDVLGGALAYRGDMARFLRFYRDFMQTAPDQLAVEINVLLESQAVGAQPTVVAIACWSGEQVEGRRVLHPLRSFGPPLADTIDMVPYAGLALRLAGLSAVLPPQTNRRPEYNYWRGGSLRELNDPAIEQLTAAAQHAPSGCSIGLGHYMHGQVCRVSVDKTPLSRTAGQLTYFFSASWVDPRMADASIEWVSRSWVAMEPWSARTTYINYLSSDDQTSVKASYGQSYDRLAVMKQKYDPTNFFHRNRNIKPA